MDHDCINAHDIQHARFPQNGMLVDLTQPIVRW